MTKIFATLIIISLITFPEQMLASSINTISLWLSKVFPSLFPFMVCTSMLLKSGGAEIFGKLLQPIMKPLFRLNGVASFPLIMGMLSGYPVGAKITSELYIDKKINLSQAKHLLYFTNNPGPLFLIGTVGTSFFSAPEFGYLMLISCSLGAILCGVLYGIFKKDDTLNSEILSKCSIEKINSSHNNTNIQTLSFFEILNESISNSLVTVCQIGGFMIFFSVVITCLNSTFLLDFLCNLLSFIPVSSDFLKGFFSGIIEMTTGVYALSIAPDSTDVRLIFSCVLVSFGGCSIIGQTFSIIRNLPIKKSHYIMAKIFNSALSSLIFFLLYKYFHTPKTTEAFKSLYNKIEPFFSTNTQLLFILLILSPILLRNLALKLKK